MVTRALLLRCLLSYSWFNYVVSRFAQDLISRAALELAHTGSCIGFLQTVTQEREELDNVRARLKEGARSLEQLRELRKQVVQVNTQNEQLLRERHEMIADLKDELQETKMRISLEGKYVRKEATTRVTMAKIKSQREQQLLGADLARTRAAVESENSVHKELLQFLVTHHQALSEKLDMWAAKHEQETEAKARQLEKLKLDRARDLTQLQDLSERCKEYEQVVKQELKSKDDQRKNAERALIELAATVRLQAWWRGQMVRHKLGGGKKVSRRPGPRLFCV